MSFEKMKGKSLKLFRGKKDIEALSLFRDILLKIENKDPDVSDLPNHKVVEEKRNIYNNMLASIYRILSNQEITDKDELTAYLDEYKEYLDQYLIIARKTATEDLKTWSENIILILFENSFKIAILRNASDISDTEIQKESLRKDIKSLYQSFVNCFCRVNEFAEIMFSEKYLDLLYYERRNVNRGGYSGQNYLNALWLSELFLEPDMIKREPRTAKIRAAVMNLLSEIVLYSPLEEDDKRFGRERKAIEWLNKSIDEDPDNIYAKERKSQLTIFITSAEQINRFKHDAVSKIETIRGTIKKAIDLTSSSIVQETLKSTEASIDYILSSFRLTQKGIAKSRRIDLEKLFEQFNEDQLEKRITGKKRLIESDAGYILLILKNLIQNSKEAYGNSAYQKVRLSFDYDTKTFKVRDYAGGIPSDLVHNDKLYEPYASTKGIYQNSGLGLANVKEACRLINAELSFEIISENSEKGTEFVIKLNEEEED